MTCAAPSWTGTLNRQRDTYTAVMNHPAGDRVAFSGTHTPGAQMIRLHGEPAEKHWCLDLTRDTETQALRFVMHARWCFRIEGTCTRTADGGYALAQDRDAWIPDELYDAVVGVLAG